MSHKRDMQDLLLTACNLGLLADVSTPSPTRTSPTPACVCVGHVISSHLTRPRFGRPL